MHAVMERPSVGNTQQMVDEAFRQHLEQHFSGDKLLPLKVQFAHEHLVPLRGFCPPELFESLKNEAFGLMERYGVARNFNLEITDNTPRHMTTVGQPIIVQHGPLIHATYFSQPIKEVLSLIVGEELHTCPYAGEHYVISQLRKSGDTHGWHWDDYAYGFVLILEAPHYRDGGFVQGVPHTGWDKQNPDVYGALIQSQVHSYAFEAGDAYLVKTDTTMHRVHPIRGDARRTIINTTWANGDDLLMAKTHETNDLLFGGAAPDPVSGI